MLFPFPETNIKNKICFCLIISGTILRHSSRFSATSQIANPTFLVCLKIQLRGLHSPNEINHLLVASLKMLIHLIIQTRSSDWKFFKSISNCKEPMIDDPNQRN